MSKFNLLDSNNYFFLSALIEEKNYPFSYLINLLKIAIEKIKIIFLNVQYKYICKEKFSTKHHSVERFADTLKKIKYKKNFKVNILKCPYPSKGCLEEVIPHFNNFNQGDINHILGDIKFISILMDRKKQSTLFRLQVVR